MDWHSPSTAGPFLLLDGLHLNQDGTNPMTDGTEMLADGPKRNPAGSSTLAAGASRLPARPNPVEERVKRLSGSAILRVDGTNQETAGPKQKTDARNGTRPASVRLRPVLTVLQPAMRRAVPGVSLGRQTR